MARKRHLSDVQYGGYHHLGLSRGHQLTLHPLVVQGAVQEPSWTDRFPKDAIHQNRE